VPKQETKSEPVQLAPPAAAASTPMAVPSTPCSAGAGPEVGTCAAAGSGRGREACLCSNSCVNRDIFLEAAKAGVLSSPRRPLCAAHHGTWYRRAAQPEGLAPSSTGRRTRCCSSLAPRPRARCEHADHQQDQRTGSGTPLTHRSMSAGTTTLVMVPGVSLGRSTEQQQGAVPGSALGSMYGSSGTPQQQKTGIGGEQERLREQRCGAARRSARASGASRMFPVRAVPTRGKGAYGEQAEAADPSRAAAHQRGL